MPTFIIEHLEPDLFPWCIIEYKSISKIVGKDNLWFTNINPKDTKRLSKYGKVLKESVKFLNLSNACILDPEAEKTLAPKDDGFQYFIFGGILGDNPPRKRTGLELSKFLPNLQKRNLGKGQFSTDNAVFVAYNIIVNQIPLKKMKFHDEIEIRKNKIESFILPYRYPLIKGKSRISKELVQFLKKKKDF